MRPRTARLYGRASRGCALRDRSAGSHRSSRPRCLPGRRVRSGLASGGGMSCSREGYSPARPAHRSMTSARLSRLPSTVRRSASMRARVSGVARALSVSVRTTIVGDLRLSGRGFGRSFPASKFTHKSSPTEADQRDGRVCIQALMGH
jgi:hypothetical protein